MYFELTVQKYKKYDSQIRNKHSNIKNVVHEMFRAWYFVKNAISVIPECSVTGIDVGDGRPIGGDKELELVLRAGANVINVLFSFCNHLKNTFVNWTYMHPRFMVNVEKAKEQK